MLVKGMVEHFKTKLKKKKHMALPFMSAGLGQSDILPPCTKLAKILIA